MAPSGLQGFMEKSGRVHRTISITEAIDNHRKLHDQKPLIVIDGSCSRGIFIEKDPVKHLTGGQFKLYKHKVDKFVDFFLDLDVKLVVFFDGCHVSEMRPRWISRKTEMAEKCHRVLDALDNGEGFSKWDVLLPCNIVVVIKSGFLGKCEVKLSTFRECDAEIISYANEHNAMAVMSQDADFAVSQGSWQYWSFKDIDFNKKTVGIYDRDELAKTLGLRVEQLPMFRTLIGNDYVLKESLTSFYRSLRVRDRAFGFVRSDKFKKVAQFVKQYDDSSTSYHTIAKKALVDMKNLSDAEKTALIKSSVESYKGTNFQPNEFLSEDTQWNSVLQETLRQIQNCKISPGVFDIMHNNIYETSNSWEDFRKTDILPSGILWRPLRAKIYGILLRDCPHEVKIVEWICAQVQDMTKPVVVEPVAPKCDLKHYTLVDFWADDKNEELIELSWILFRDTINEKLPMERVRNLDERVLICVLVLLYMSKDCNLSEDEIEAFLLVNVLCSTKDNLEDLVQRSSSKIDTRALRLSTVFMRGINVMRVLVDSVGCIVDRKFLEVWNIFDGQLFQSFFNFSENKMLDYKTDMLFVQGKKFYDDFENLF